MQIKDEALIAVLLIAIATAVPAKEKTVVNQNTPPSLLSQTHDLLMSGDQKKIQQAIKTLRHSAENHSTEAQRLLGDAYSKGLGVEKDLTLAFKHYAEAARQLDPMAQYEVAKAYFMGLGTDINIISAYMWATLSQNQLKESSLRSQTVQLREKISKLLTEEQIEKARMLSGQLQNIYLSAQ